MSRLIELPYCWRLSRYEPQVRARESQWESWVGYSDIGRTFNGIPLSAEEYVRVENVYIDAVTRFAIDCGAEVFRIVYLGHQAGGFSLAEGQALPRSDVAPVVRANLRGVVDCALEAAGGTCQIEFGYDLYVAIAATSPCEDAVVEAARGGLYVEGGVPLALW